MNALSDNMQLQLNILNSENNLLSFGFDKFLKKSIFPSQYTDTSDYVMCQDEDRNHNI